LGRVLENNEGRLRPLLHALIESPAFTHRRGGGSRLQLASHDVATQ
jgi:hypothetical protein